MLPVLVSINLTSPPGLNSLPPGFVIPIDLTNPAASANFLVDMDNGFQIPVGTQSPAQLLAFQQAFVALFGIVSRYGWLDSTSYPDPIPSELLVPFSQYMAANNLTAAMQIFRPVLLVGGLGHFENLTTLYALKNLRRGILALFSVPHSGIVIAEGCGFLYNAIRNYVGYDKITTSATIIDISRPEADDDDHGHGGDNRRRRDDGGWGDNDDDDDGHGRQPVFMQVRLANGHVDSYRCGSIFVTFAPFVNSVNFMHLDHAERQLWSKLQARYYYAFELNVNGPANVGSLNVYNYDLDDPLGFPDFPAVLAMRRTIPYGPMGGWASSNTDTT